MRLRAALTLFLLFAASGCQAGASLGTTCTRGSECATGTCEFGRCRAGCRANRDCPAGSSCLLDASGVGACSLEIDLGCESGVGRVCASGLVCVGDRCERACGGPSDCPSDGECRAASSGGAMFCFDPRTAPDAGPIDAGTIDGGASDAGALDAGDDAANVQGDAATGCTITDMCFERAGAACALDCMGRVWCWGQQHGGRLGNGQLGDATVTAPVRVIDGGGTALVGADSLSCGDGFACAHLSSTASAHAGHVLCWGYEASRAFDGSATSANAVDLFTPIVGDHVTLAGAWHHMCALDRDTGSALCFGINDAVIDPAMPLAQPFPMPTAPTLAPTWMTALAVSTFGACALVGGASEVRCWGRNQFGESGRSPIESVAGVEDPNLGVTTIERSAGVPLAQVTELTTGYSHRAVLARSGASGPITLFTWGSNEHAQLGDRPDAPALPCDDVAAVGNVCRAYATTPASAPSFTTIASQGESLTSCGIIASSHHVLCWGDNLSAHAGVPGAGVEWLTNNHQVLIDGTTAAIDDAVRVFVGNANACATRGDGSLWCWGPNADAQLALPIDALEHFAVRIPIPNP